MMTEKLNLIGALLLVAMASRLLPPFAEYALSLAYLGIALYQLMAVTNGRGGDE